jgi:glycogen operon protein
MRAGEAVQRCNDVLAVLLWLAPVPPAQAASTQNLGAKYDGTQSSITFGCIPARHPHRGLDYKTASGAQQTVKYVMTKDAATNVWSKSVSVATLKNTYGITGPVYYGYRAWGPNWPYNSGWAKGTGRLPERRGRQRQPLQPNNAIDMPWR